MTRGFPFALRPLATFALLLCAAGPSLAAPPVGWLERLDEHGVAHGWAASDDAPGESLWLHFYVEGASYSLRYAGAALADLERVDVRQAGYPGRHGFSFTLPAWARTGELSLLRAFAIDPRGRVNAELNGSPMQVQQIAAPASTRRRVELLGDPRLAAGVRVVKPLPTGPQDLFVSDAAGAPVVLRRPGVGGLPSWQVAQHHARFELGHGPGTWLPDGGLRWADAEKAFTLGPDGHVTLAINSRTSYQNRFRDPTAPSYRKDWPHLYIEQGIPARPETRVADMRALRLNLEARLAYADHDTGPGYNQNWHTGQLVLYLTVVDRRNGDYLWYGCGLYDARGGDYAAAEQWDGDGTDNSTGKLIRSVARATLVSAPLEDGGWVTVSGDLLPDIVATLRRHVANGNLRGSLADFEVGSFLIGWEAPGLFVGTVEARGLSLQAEVD